MLTVGKHIQVLHETPASIAAREENSRKRKRYELFCTCKSRRKPRPWHSGKRWILACVLIGGLPLLNGTPRAVALSVVAVISVLACLPVHRQRQDLGAAPKRVRVKP